MMKKNTSVGYTMLRAIIDDLALEYRDVMRILGVSKSNVFRMLKELPRDSKYRNSIQEFYYLILDSEQKEHECSDVSKLLNAVVEAEHIDIVSRISKLQFEHNKMKTQLKNMVELHNRQVRAFHHIDYITKNPGSLPSLEVNILKEKLYFFEDEYKKNSPIHHRRMELKIQLIEMELAGLNKLLNDHQMFVEDEKNIKPIQ